MRRGRWADNVFIERLWRSLKCEDVHLKGYADGCEAARGIAVHDEGVLTRRWRRAPMAVWRDAVAGEGMMDSASALPTCPQQPQKRMQSLAA